MKKIIPVFLALLICICLSVFVIYADKPTAEVAPEEAASVAEATVAEEVTTTPIIKIAILDVQGLLNESDAALSLKEQATKWRDQYQEEYKAIEEELKKSQEAILKKTKNASNKKKIEARKGFEKELEAANQKIADKKKSLEMAAGEATRTLREEILKIVATMSAQKDLDLVLSRQDVVIVSKEYDITADVMAELNENVKTIKLDVK